MMSLFILIMRQISESQMTTLTFCARPYIGLLGTGVLKVTHFFQIRNVPTVLMAYLELIIFLIEMIANLSHAIEIRNTTVLNP